MLCQLTLPLRNLRRVRNLWFGAFDPNGGAPHLYIFKDAGNGIMQRVIYLSFAYSLLCNMPCCNSCHWLFLLLLPLPPIQRKMSSYFEERAPCCGSHFWILLSMCWASVLFAAITSGLALGLLSFSQVDLEVFVKAGQPKIQKNAGSWFRFV